MPSQTSCSGSATPAEIGNVHFHNLNSAHGRGEIPVTAREVWIDILSDAPHLVEHLDHGVVLKHSFSSDRPIWLHNGSEHGSAG